MRLFPSLVALGGLVSMGFGVALFLAPASDPVPVVPRSVAPTESASARPTGPAPLTAAGPWQRVAAPVRTPEPKPAIEQPTPAPQPRPQTGALVFLGRVVTDTQAIRYFFKEKATGLVVGLITGEARQGWKLTEVNEKAYLLEGPGGLYEVAR